MLSELSEPAPQPPPAYPHPHPLFLNGTELDTHQCRHGSVIRNIRLMAAQVKGLGDTSQPALYSSRNIGILSPKSGLRGRPYRNSTGATRVDGEQRQSPRSLREGLLLILSPLQNTVVRI